MGASGGESEEARGKRERRTDRQQKKKEESMVRETSCETRPRYFKP